MVNYKYIMASGQEESGGKNMVWAEVDNATELTNVVGYTGSVGTIKGDRNILYVYDGTLWKLLDKPDLPELFDGIDPITLLVVNKLMIPSLLLLNTAIQTTPDRKQYHLLDALPVVESELYEGMAVYNLTDHTFQVLTTPGEQESDTLTVTEGAVTTSGNITITLNEEAVTVAVVEDDTAAAVAAKIKAAIDAAVVAETIDPWMVAIDGAELNFLKGAVGTAAAPTAVDTGETGVTFSAFARTNEGVASVWTTLINAS